MSDMNKTLFWNGIDCSAGGNNECGEYILKSIADDLAGALELAEKWLMNCMPIVNLEGAKPLPVIRAALERYKEGM